MPHTPPPSPLPSRRNSVHSCAPPAYADNLPLPNYGQATGELGVVTVQPFDEEGPSPNQLLEAQARGQRSSFSSYMCMVGAFGCGGAVAGGSLCAAVSVPVCVQVAEVTVIGGVLGGTCVGAANGVLVNYLAGKCQNR